MKLKYLFITVVSMLVLASCGSGKHATGPSGYEVTNPNAPLAKKELRERFASLEGSYLDWQDVKVPVKLKLKSPKSFNVSGTMTMTRERSIYLSMRVFGIEVASMMVTTDSIYALYKMDKIYFAEDIAGFLGDVPATVGNLQDLLLGRVFQIGYSRPEVSHCSLAGTQGEWLITPSGAPRGITYEFAVQMPDNRVRTMSVNVPGRKPIVATYSDFENTEAGAVAGTTEIETSTSKTSLNAELEFNFNKAEWNTGGIKSWSTPRGYRRVTKAQVMKILNSLGKI
jgi:hypothetical protein